MAKRLLLLNGLAALMIGFHHAAAFTMSAMFDWTNRYRDVSVPNYDLVGSFPYYVILTIRQLDGFAIPAFLFVSGFFISFLARGQASQLRLAMVLPRIKLLLVPFALWTGIRIALTGSLPSSLPNLLGLYYYIPVIIQLYLLSPLLLALAKRNWMVLIGLAAFVQIGAEGARYLQALGMASPVTAAIVRLTPQWFFPGLMLYFSIGMVFGLHAGPMGKWLHRYRWHLLVLVVGAGLLTIIEHEVLARLTGQQWMGRTFDGISRTIYATSFTLCFVAFLDAPTPFARQLTELSSKSLGIYLMNTPAVFAAGSLMYHLTPWVLGMPLLYFTIQLIVGLGGPILLMELIRRSPAQRVQRFAFG
jgi:surface polysaccharide O-acyltransferase-like enzyme